MNKKVKPFRLINCQELERLQQRFTNSLLLWNKQHALFSLSCHLSCNQRTELLTNEYVRFTEQEKPVALLAQQDWSAIKNCLFGDVSACFNAVSETLFITLLNQLLSTQSLQQHSGHEIHFDEWFYSGAPSLTMTLSGVHQSMTLYLHPQWVLTALGPHEIIQPPMIGDLQSALEPQLLHWQVELNPVSLPLEEILRLQVGDVIRTDHPLTTPLLLKNNQQTVCHVDIGKINHYKSIQITSSL